MQNLIPLWQWKNSLTKLRFICEGSGKEHQILMHIINIFFLVYSGSTFFVNARLLTIEDHSTTFGESTFLDCQLQSITVNVTHFCLYQTKTLHASGCLKRMKREREREGGGWGWWMVLRRPLASGPHIAMSAVCLTTQQFTFKE